MLAATNHQQAAITDRDVEKRIEALWQESEQQLAVESHGRLMVVASGHDIQLLEPEAVISALRSCSPARRLANPGTGRTLPVRATV